MKNWFEITKQRKKLTKNISSIGISWLNDLQSQHLDEIPACEIVLKVRIICYSSFPRKWKSCIHAGFEIPACAGMTKYLTFYTISCAGMTIIFDYLLFLDILLSRFKQLSSLIIYSSWTYYCQDSNNIYKIMKINYEN
jgi:hypothetical protein